MAGNAPPRKGPPSPNGAPTLTPLGHYAGRPDIPISRQVTVVGSKAGSRLHLASSTVSNSHAIIVNSAAGPYIRDLASRHHVFINGREQREGDLADGDLIQIGKFKFQFNTGIIGGVEPGRSAAVGEHDPAPGAILNVEGGEMPIPIEERGILIGRRPTCDIPLIEDSVSTVHAVIFEMSGKRFIRDLGSRTGTLVNGRKIDQQQELKFGDEIRIGETNIAYASATGAVAERDVDEMDHLVSTAPLGTAALDLPLGDDGAVGAAEPDEAVAAEDRDTISMAGDEAEDGEAPAPMAEAEPPAAAEDQVRLDSDPDVSGGPGDTAVLPPTAEPKGPRKIPTLRARLVESDEVEERAPEAAPEPAAPESAATEEDLSGSRRGWRGMTVGESNAPTAEEEPAPAEADVQPEAEVQPEAAPTPESELEPELKPVAEPEAVAEQPPVEVHDADDEEEIALAVEPAASPAPVEEESPPPHVTVGEEVDELPAETFDVHDHDDADDAVATIAPVSDEEAPAEELHLPPVIDETPDEDAIEPIPLTPEEGAPLDLSVDEPSIIDERPEPTLDLREPEPEPPPAALVADLELEPEPQAKPKRKRPSRKKKSAEDEVAPEIEAEAAPEPAPELAPPVEPVAEAAGGDAVEVLEETLPTPESALSIDDAVAEMLAEPLSVDDAAETAGAIASEMTDTGFGRAVDSFVGESTGPLVEARDEAKPEAEPVAEAPAAQDETPAPELEPVAEAPEQLIAADESTEPAEAPDIDDLVADVMSSDTTTPESDAAVAREDAAVEALDLEIEAALNDDTIAGAPALDEAEEAAEEQPQPVAEAPQLEDEPPQLDAPEFTQPAADAAEPEPPAPSPVRPAVLGPNQEHFLGGMPLRLNKPAQSGGTAGSGGAAAARALRRDNQRGSR